MCTKVIPNKQTTVEILAPEMAAHGCGVPHAIEGRKEVKQAESQTAGDPIPAPPIPSDVAYSTVLLASSSAKWV